MDLEILQKFTALSYIKQNVYSQQNKLTCIVLYQMGLFYDNQLDVHYPTYYMTICHLLQFKGSILIWLVIRETDTNLKYSHANESSILEYCVIILSNLHFAHNIDS